MRAPTKRPSVYMTEAEYAALWRECEGQYLKADVLRASLLEVYSHCLESEIRRRVYLSEVPAEIVRRMALGEVLGFESVVEVAGSVIEIERKAA